MVVGATILAHMGASYVTGSNMSAAEKFASLSGGYRVSNHVPACFLPGTLFQRPSPSPGQSRCAIDRPR